MISIVLPVKNAVKHLPAAVKSIIENTKFPYELLIIDGGSTDGTEKLIEEWEKQIEQITTHHIISPGLITAINYGIEMAGNNDVYLTQDDVILPNLYGRDWLEELYDLSLKEDCGAVTTLEAGGISGPSYIDGMNWVGTWSIYIPRSTINKIGLFDENFNPGNGDDIDYSYRIFKEKLKIYVANFWVDHHRLTDHPISMLGDEEANEKLKIDHAEYFRRKWKLGEFADES